MKRVNSPLGRHGRRGGRKIPVSPRRNRAAEITSGYRGHLLDTDRGGKGVLRLNCGSRVDRRLAYLIIAFGPDSRTPRVNDDDGWTSGGGGHVFGSPVVPDPEVAALID